MRQATRQNSLGAPSVATDTVCTLPDHRCHDKRRWQRVTSSEATLLVRPQALLRWHTATLLFRPVFWALPYPLLSAFHRPYKPNHPSIGLFRLLNWATSPRSGWRCAQLRAGPASGALAGRAEVHVPPVTESHIDAARPQAERWTHTPRTMVA